MNIWQRFLRALKPVQQITLINTGEQMGPHKADWLAFQARKAMGTKWVAHPANSVLSHKQLLALAKERQAASFAVPNVRHFERKKAQS